MTTRTQRHGTAVTEIRSADGATAVIADHGAHLLSWIPASGDQGIFLSEKSRYGPGDAIRGGVPVIFPQFSDRGSGQRHGFARNVQWRLLDVTTRSDVAIARFGLTNDDVGLQSWPHRFALEFEVKVGGQQLQLTLDVHNPSDERWECAAAFHTYLRIDAGSPTRIDGLQGVSYLDNVRADLRCVQTEQSLVIQNEIDRIYLDAPDSVRVDDGNRIITIAQHGFTDTVVWNPGKAKGDALADLAPGAFHSFVCVEAASVNRPIVVEAGGFWQGSQLLTLGDNQD